MPNKIASNIIVNGTSIDTCRKVIVNGAEAETVKVNGIVVYQKACPPTRPISLSVTNSSCEHHTLTWNYIECYPSCSYDVYRNGSLLTSNITSPYTTTCNKDQSDSYYIKAHNIAGEINSNTINIVCTPCLLFWESKDSRGPGMFWCGFFNYAGFGFSGRTISSAIMANIAGSGPGYGNYIDATYSGVGNGSSTYTAPSGDYDRLVYTDTSMYYESNYADAYGSIGWDTTNEVFSGITTSDENWPCYDDSCITRHRLRTSGDMICFTEQMYNSDSACGWSQETYAEWVYFRRITK